MDQVTSLERKDMAWLALACRTGISLDVFSRAVAEEAEKLRRNFPCAVDARVRHAYDPLQGTRKAAALANGPAPFDAIISLTSAAADLGEQAPLTCSGTATRLNDVIEPVRCAAIVGTRHIVRPGEGKYMNAYCLRPARGKTIAQAQEHWSTVYRRMTQARAERSRSEASAAAYAQFHADESASRALAEAAGLGLSDFMGAAVGFSDDVRWINRAIKQSESTTVGESEEANFIDVDRSCLAHYELIEN